MTLTSRLAAPVMSCKTYVSVMGSFSETYFLFIYTCYSYTYVCTYACVCVCMLSSVAWIAYSSHAESIPSVTQPDDHQIRGAS